VASKRKSRQTRRYTAARPKSGAAMAKARKKAAWRKMGGGRQRATWPWALALTVVIVGGVVGIVASSASTNSSSSSSNSGSPGPAIATVASFDNGSPGTTIDGIKCTTNEQLAYHVHSHLAIFVNGQAMGIPMGIGIAPPRQTQPGATGDFVVGGSCFYELHAHTADGVIHIESPTPGKVYTLGEYFDIWNQPLGPDQVASATGKVTAYRNGQLVSGNPRNILLGAHVVIQLDVGKVVAPKPYTFAAGL